MSVVFIAHDVQSLLDLSSRYLCSSTGSLSCCAELSQEGRLREEILGEAGGPKVWGAVVLFDGCRPGACQVAQLSQRSACVRRVDARR